MTTATATMTTILDIKKDIEFVNTQIQFLETYIQKIKKVFKQNTGFSKYWSGPGKNEAVYKEINGWLTNYAQLKKHLEAKVIHDLEVNRMLSELPNLSFTIPTSFPEDKVTGLKNLSYQLLPPYRMSYNAKKIKQIASQIDFFENSLMKMKSISFKIEGYYMDGV